MFGLTRLRCPECKGRLNWGAVKCQHCGIDVPKVPNAIGSTPVEDLSFRMVLTVVVLGVMLSSLTVALFILVAGFL